MKRWPLVMLASINQIPDSLFPMFPPMLPPMPMRHSVSIFDPPGQYLDIMGLVRDIGDSQACPFISDMAEAIGIDIRKSRHFRYVSGTCVFTEGGGF